MSVTPFRCDLPLATFEDLRHRLSATRWPDEPHGLGWRFGAPQAFVRRVCDHWGWGFDWPAWEARLNALPQVRATIDGVGLHAVHVPAGPQAPVMLLANGWPSSIFEYLDLIPRLVAAGVTVVAPALPGYGFSDRPTLPGMTMGRVADLFAGLMDALGHSSYVAHGSDMGAGVVDHLRRRHPASLRGVHFSNVYWGYTRPQDPTPAEQAYFQRVAEWQRREGAYAMLHGTKPVTLSYGLNDSPAGLAAWILEKFHAWSDGEPESVYGLDGLCANLTLYWATETIGSSVRFYAESFQDPGAREGEGRGAVPAGVIVFPKDIIPAPRDWADRNLRLVRWTEAPRGGHFAAWETPDLLADDLLAFLRDLG